MPNVYGPHIKEIRVQKGIKAAFVAYRIKVSRSTYSEIESGKRGLSAERLCGILPLIDLTLPELKALVKGEPQVKKEATRSKKGGGRNDV